MLGWWGADWLTRPRPTYPPLCTRYNLFLISTLILLPCHAAGVGGPLNSQTKLCHTLALAAAEAETGLSRPSIDRAFIPVLLELMADPGSRRGPDVPLQACRALNYLLQV